MFVSAIPLMMQMLQVGEGTGGADILADYYVDSVDGDDGNDGSTPALAFQTITKVNTLTLAANEIVAFKGGQTHRVPFAGLVIGQSGSSGTPITITSYGTGKAIINGAADGTAMTWSNPSGNIYKSEAIGHSEDYWKRINQIYTDQSPADDWSDSGGMRSTGIECGGLWGNSFTQDGGADRWFTSLNNPFGLTFNNLALDGVLQGAPETSIANVNSSGKWIVINNRLYLYSTSNPSSAFSSIVPAQLSSDGDWIYVYDGADGYILMYHSGGSPATQFSTLEIPNCKVAVIINNVDYIHFENIEIRHGCEGLWIGNTGNSDNCTGLDVDIYQCCRNGLQIRGNDNTFTATTLAYSHHCGTHFQQKPQDQSQQLGHAYHLVNGDGNTVEKYSLKYAAEDGCQHAQGNAVLDDNWLIDCQIGGNKEDGIDCKDGKVNVSGGSITAKGDGESRRNGILLHNGCTGLYVEDCTITTEDAATGNGTGDCITRESGASRPITLKRVTLNGHAQARYLIDAKQGSGNVTTEDVVWQHRGVFTPAMTLVNGHWASTNDSGNSLSSAGGTAMFLLQGGSGGTNTLKNPALRVDGRRILGISNNGGLAITYGVLYRADQTAGYIDDDGNVLSQSQISGYSSGNASIDANTDAEDPDFDDAANMDLTITAGAGAASGGNASDQPATDRNGVAFTTTERGAYSLTS